MNIKIYKELDSTDGNHMELSETQVHVSEGNYYIWVSCILSTLTIYE